MQTARGASMEDGQTPFANWVKTNASTANLLSIIMLIFAAWAAVEIATNVVGNEVPPVTGTEVPGDDQRTNDGKIIGLGAVAGTLGLVLQLLISREESESVVESQPEEDEEIDEVVDIIVRTSRTRDGHPGDGKVLVSRLVRAVRIEDGAANESALQPTSS